MESAIIDKNSGGVQSAYTRKKSR